MDLESYIKEVNISLSKMDNGNYVEAHKSLKIILNSKSFLELKKKDQFFIKKRYSRLLLALGYFEEGWHYFKYNWIKNSFKFKEIFEQNNTIKYLIDLDQIQKNEKLLIWNDGGYGDFIYQLRLIKNLQSRIKLKIYDNELGHLLKDKKLLVSSSETFDWHLPVVEIPRVLKYNTIDYQNFNYNYLIDPTRKYEKYDNYIGLSYKTETSKSKSIDIKFLKRLFVERKDLNFLIIQKYLEKKDINFFSDFKNVTVIEDLDKNKIFEDTFNILNSVNSVISIDSVISHIAGYLGKRNYLLLSYQGHFYWGYNKKKCNDYPNHIIVKQKDKGDWDTVINEVIKLV